MKAEPAEPGRDLIAATVADRWGIEPRLLEYLPVGGGGHHWRVTGADSTRWFVTANGLLRRGHWLEPDADAVFRRTALAYETVRNLDLPFALAAIPDHTGSVLYRIHAEWGVSIYPYVESVHIEHEQSVRAVAGFIGRLHALTPPAGIPRWRSDLPQRQHLERVIAERERAGTWGPGPYAEPTRALVRARHRMLNELLDRYDRLLVAIHADPGPYVLTHGEPHAGNTVQTADGRTLLIDWDTLALAPPERDLWQLGDFGDGLVRDAYTAAACGSLHRPRPEYMELFPLWWRLAGIGSCIGRFRTPHADDADTAAAWRELETSTA